MITFILAFCLLDLCLIVPCFYEKKVCVGAVEHVFYHWERPSKFGFLNKIFTHFPKHAKIQNLENIMRYGILSKLRANYC